MVITFLPFPSFKKCAQSLDNQRLGKQRAEAKGIYNVLTDPNTKGNKNIPQVIMWAGCEAWLLAYCFEICQEWTGRGYNDSVLYWCLQKMSLYGNGSQEDLILNQYETMPAWLGSPALHQSHRARLVAKDWGHYAARLGWRDGPGSYFWPGSSEKFRKQYGDTGLFTTIKSLNEMDLLAQQTSAQIQQLLE